MQAARQATRLEAVSLRVEEDLSPQDAGVLASMPALVELWVHFPFGFDGSKKQAVFSRLRERLPELETLEEGPLDMEPMDL